MMGARPVVASRAGGNVELITDGDSGLLFDIGDDVGLAGLLARLAGDAPLRARLGEGALARAQSEFSVPAMVRAYEQHYGEAARVPVTSR
jgi:glycosyltransferase involved in cell wall biosynthesis